MTENEQVDDKAPAPDVKFAQDIDWAEADLDTLIEGVKAGFPEALEEFNKQFLGTPDK